MNQLKCLQINLHYSKAASAELNARKENITFINEPYCGATKRVQMLNRLTSQIFSHIGDSRPRAAMLVDKNLNPWLVPNFTDRDICVVTIKIRTQTVYLCSMYLDIELEVQNEKFLALVEHCHRERIPLITGMDSNAHSELWGCEEHNTRGEELEDFFMTKNLTIMNVGCEPTFETKRAKSIIDLTVVNTWTLQKLNLMDWMVRPEASFSDHKYISFGVEGYVPVEEMYRNLNKADWMVFQSTLNLESLPCIHEDGKNLDECANALQENIQMALDAACPLRKATNQMPHPWWTPEIDQVKRELKTLCMRRRRSEEAEDAYKSLRKTYTKMITKSRRESWRKFCSQAETAKEISKIVKILKPRPMKGISLFSSQGHTLTPRETLDNLMDTHFLDSTQVVGEVNEAVPMRKQELDSNDVVNYIDDRKVSEALLSFGPHKAAGPDGFKPLVLQKLTFEYVTYITKLYKTAIMTGYAPKAWRVMRVTFIPKEGKADYGTAKAYRPITLSNFLLKGLERMVQWYINDNIIKTSLYGQHAYTAGRSCDTAISEVVDHIEKNIYRGQHVLAVSLDCTGAFDRIKFDSADKAMEEMQIPSSIKALYTNIVK